MIEIHCGFVKILREIAVDKDTEDFKVRSVQANLREIFEVNKI